MKFLQTSHNVDFLGLLCVEKKDKLNASALLYLAVDHVGAIASIEDEGVSG